jgi:purine-binding chemotaxis protein CheW
MNRIAAGTQGAPVTASAVPRQFLTFLLGGEMYAVGILRIKEIIEFGALTAVPMMPTFIRGVINLRGAVVPVVDLNARFGGGPTKIGRRTCIVIIEIEADGESQVVGVLVDAVNEVLDIADADIEPAPSFGTQIRPDFVAGMGKVAGNFVILLDLGRVLAVDELASVVASAGAGGLTSAGDAPVTH